MRISAQHRATPRSSVERAFLSFPPSISTEGTELVREGDEQFNTLASDNEVGDRPAVPKSLDSSEDVSGLIHGGETHQVSLEKLVLRGLWQVGAEDKDARALPRLRRPPRWRGLGSAIESLLGRCGEQRQCEQSAGARRHAEEDYALDEQQRFGVSVERANGDLATEGVGSGRKPKLEQVDRIRGSRRSGLTRSWARRADRGGAAIIEDLEASLQALFLPRSGNARAHRVHRATVTANDLANIVQARP